MHWTGKRIARVVLIAGLTLMPATAFAHGGVDDGDGDDGSIWQPPPVPAIDPDKVYQGLNDLKSGVEDSWKKLWGG